MIYILCKQAFKGYAVSKEMQTVKAAEVSYKGKGFG